MPEERLILMKKYLIFLFVIILAAAVGSIPAGGDAAPEMPRVDLLGLEEPGILDLTAV